MTQETLCALWLPSRSAKW